MCASHTCKDNSEGLMGSRKMNIQPRRAYQEHPSLGLLGKPAHPLKQLLDKKGTKFWWGSRKRRPEKDYLSKDFSLKNLWLSKPSLALLIKGEFLKPPLRILTDKEWIHQRKDTMVWGPNCNSWLNYHILSIISTKQTDINGAGKRPMNWSGSHSQISSQRDFSWTWFCLKR